MSKPPIAKALISAMRNACSVDRLWQGAIQNDAPVTTPLAVYSSSELSRIGILSGRQEKPRLGFLNYLSGVTANPSSATRTDLIRRYFVFPVANEFDEGVEPVVNASRVRLEQAVRAWGDKARELNDAYLAAAAGNQNEPGDLGRLSVVVGDRGVGKTFLQNYIVSEFTPLLDALKVLWIRISLVREADEHWDLDSWIKAQIVKVLCRYYDPRSKRCIKDPENPMLFNMDEVFTEAKRGLSMVGKERLQTMLRLLRCEVPAVDRDIASSWITQDLADVVFGAAVERGIGFVVVLDGLDLLGNSQTLKHRFKTRFAEVAKYMASDAPLWRYHLLFVRDESTWLIESHFKEHQHRSAEQYRSVADYRVVPVKLENVLDQRFNALEDKVICDKLGYSHASITGFRQFLSETDGGVADTNGNALTYAGVLKGLLGTNTRSAMQVLHSAAYEYTRNQGGAHYQLTDYLMRQGQDLPPSAPVYRRVADDGVERLERQHRGGAHAIYDATFLPSIVRFPFVQGALAATELKDNNRGQILMGLRLVQVATILERHEAAIETLDLGSLVSHTTALFMYDEVAVRAMADELLDEEILQPVPHARPLRGDPTIRPLRVTPKGRQIRDWYLFDPAYLNIAAYTLPVPATLIVNASGWINVVKTRPEASFMQVVYGKIANAIFMSELIATTSQMQHKELEGRRRRLGDKATLVLKSGEIQVSYQHGGLFTFIDKLRDEVDLVCERIMSTLNDSNYRLLIDQCRNVGAIVVE